MKKINEIVNTYIIAPLVIILTGVLKITDWSNDIKTFSQELYSTLEFLSLCGAVYIYYFSIFSPYKKYQKLQNRKYEVIEDLFKELNTDYPGMNLSLNIMLVKDGFMIRREPKKNDNTKTKFQWKQKVFYVLRAYNDEVAKSLKFTTRQGLCGKVYKEVSEQPSKTYAQGCVVGGKRLNLIPHHGIDMNLTTQQEQLTNDLVIVVSCPLIVKKGEGDNQTKKVIGVLNIHSKEEDSVKLLTDTDKVNEIFYRKVGLIGKIFVQLHI